MIVVDSCGWLERFAGTGLGELYDEALRDPRELLVPAVCLAEVFRTMAREAGEPAALDAVGVMSQATIVALDADAAIAAARAGLAYRLPLADSVIYAAARRAGATVWTHDDHFRDLPGVASSSRRQRRRSCRRAMAE